MIPVGDCVQHKGERALRLPPPQRPNSEENHMTFADWRINHGGLVVQLVAIREQA